LQIADCKLQIANCRLQIADCKLQIANCRLQIADGYSGEAGVAHAGKPRVGGDSDIEHENGKRKITAN
jgi:hypothetical protein